MFDEVGISPSNYRDTVGDLALAGSSTFAGTQLIRTDGSGKAAAVYRTPSDFSRGEADKDLVTRPISIRLGRSGAIETEAGLTLHRPQLAFIHGLWGSSGDFVGFDSIRSDTNQRFSIIPLNYGYDVGSLLTSSNPPYGLDILSTTKGGALGFEFGARVALRDLPHWLKAYRIGGNRLGQPIAAAQVDVITHSMGGLVARTLQADPNSATPENFGAGLVHKMISIGVPHLGSPLATELLANGNECFREKFAESGLHTFVTVNGLLNGGVGDLVPSSPALLRLPRSVLPAIPTAFLVGTMSDEQLRGVDVPDFKIWALKNIPIFGCSSDPAAGKLNSRGVPVLMGGASDGIVPLNSALNGTGTSLGTFIAIHSEGTADLGFRRPSLTGLPTVVQRTIDLINTKVSASNVYWPIK